MSGPASPPYVVVAGTRRSWTREQKRAILDEAEDTTTTVSSVARRHGLTPSLLFRWRRDAWDEEHAASLPVQSAFVPLALPAPSAAELRSKVPQDGTIEIELAGGHRLRAQTGVDLALLQGVIAALLAR